MATVPLSFSPKTLTLHSHPQTSIFSTVTNLRFRWNLPHSNTTRTRTRTQIRAAVDGDYSAKRSSSGEQRETIMLPGCDYNHWLIVMEFPKDPAPTREQMIDTYLNTLATVLGRAFPLYRERCGQKEPSNKLPELEKLLREEYPKFGRLPCSRKDEEEEEEEKQRRQKHRQ